jgi:hypothetical protein
MISECITIYSILQGKKFQEITSKAVRSSDFSCFVWFISLRTEYKLLGKLLELKKDAVIKVLTILHTDFMLYRGPPTIFRMCKKIIGVHSALVRVNEELLERKVAAPV